MAPLERQLALRARRAYELGRLQAQLWLVLPVGALTTLAVHFSGDPTRTLLTGLALLVVLGFLRWRGQELGRGALPGLCGGGLALLLPVLACASGVCSRNPSPRLILFCFAGGALAGLLLSVRAWRGQGCGLRCTVAGGFVAALTASLTCAIAGLGGVTGMVVGLALFASPALVWVRAPS